MCLHDCPIFAGDHCDLGQGMPTTAAQEFFDLVVHSGIGLCHKPFRALDIRRGLADEPISEL